MRIRYIIVLSDQLWKVNRDNELIDQERERYLQGEKWSIPNEGEEGYIEIIDTGQVLGLLDGMNATGSKVVVQDKVPMCKTLTVSLKNNVLITQGENQGTYYMSDLLENGKEFWNSGLHSIWFDIKWNRWVIGSWKDLGRFDQGISGHIYMPYDKVNWYYFWNGFQWANPGIDDVSVKCKGTNIAVAHIHR